MTAGTITTLTSAGSGLSNPRRSPYMVENIINFADMVTAKGSALEANEIIHAISVPANTMILTAGFEVTVAVQTAADGNTANLGVTGVAVSADASAPIIIGATADTIDFELQATTTAPTAGQIRVFAILMDIDAIGNAAAEVDRDQLA